MASKPLAATAWDRLSIVVPFHNEVATLREALERLLKADLPLPLQVVLVDDGSTDASVDSIAHLAGDERITFVHNPLRAGKGSAVRSGLAHCEGSLVGILDADLEYDPADLAQLARAIVDGSATVVYGSRSFGKHSTYSFWYVIGGRLSSLWASLLFNTWVSDIHTCLKMAPLEVWRSFELRGRGFDLDSEVTARFLKAGHRICEVPISYRARSRAEGKKLQWTDGPKSLWTLTRVRLRRT